MWISPYQAFSFDRGHPVASYNIMLYYYYYYYFTDLTTDWVLAFSVIFFHSALSLHSFLHSLIPIICISSSMSSVHLFLGLSLFLLPVGFHTSTLFFPFRKKKRKKKKRIVVYYRLKTQHISSVNDKMTKSLFNYTATFRLYNSRHQAKRAFSFLIL